MRKLTDNELKGLEKFAKNTFCNIEIPKETKETLKHIFNDLEFDCVPATSCVNGEQVVDWECILNIFKSYGITKEDLYRKEYHI